MDSKPCGKISQGFHFEQTEYEAEIRYNIQSFVDVMRKARLIYEFT